jgi:hypothetical protein
MQGRVGPGVMLGMEIVEDPYRIKSLREPR